MKGNRIMKRLLMAVGFAALIAGVAGCSDDNTPTGSGHSGAYRDTTLYSAADSVYTTKINASSHTDPQYYSFDSMVTALPKIALTTADWDISMLRYTLNLNGGASAENSGSVEGAKLSTTNFDAVTIADTTGAHWAEDTAKLIVDNWYIYNFQTHSLAMNDYVYTMVDAEGDNFIKFKIDSLIGPGQSSMGTVKLIYVYQPTANLNSLTGTPDTALITVGSGTGYFDFSSGAAVTPPNPETSTGWDISFSNYEVRTNGGISGPGNCKAFPMYGELVNPTDFNGVTQHPAAAPMFADYNNSIFNGDVNDTTRNWYDYNDANFELTSKDYVYLIRTETAVYKMQIQSYYAAINEVLTSGYYTFKWKEL